MPEGSQLRDEARPEAPGVELAFPEPASVKVRRAKPTVLELTRGRKVVGTLTADAATTAFVERLLDGKADDRLAETLIPKDMAAFAASVEARKQLVEARLADGRKLVERVERLVCAIYDVPDDLTEQVVAHAVRRAG